MQIKSTALALCLLLLFFASKAGRAHDPHDVIDGLAIWDSSQPNPSMLIIEAYYRLLYSVDQGASWKQLVNGLDNRYAFTDIGVAKSRHAVKALFVSSDGDGVFKSNDQGRTWKRVNNGLDDRRIAFLAVSPNYHQRNLVLAASATGGLYRSDNGGLKWQRVVDDTSRISAIAFIKGTKGMAMECILAGTSDGQILRSDDNGKKWRQIAHPAGSGAITGIGVSPAFHTDGVVFVGSLSGGVFRSSDGGRSFLPANKGLSDTTVVSVAVSPEFDRNSTVYAAGWNQAVFKTIDGGKTWKLYNRGLTKSRQAQKKGFISPHFKKIKILESNEAQNEKLFLSAFDGLFKSNDSGRSWFQLDTEPPGWIWRLSVSPAEAGDFLIAFTTLGAGAYFAHNSDLTWKVRNTGLTKVRLGQMAFSPDFNTDRTVFCIVDEGSDLIKTINAGEEWTRISLRPGGLSAYKRKVLYYLRKKGLPESLTTGLLSEMDKMPIHPKGIAVSPNYSFDRTLFVASRRAGLYKSTDKAENMRRIKDGLKEIWSIAVSPDFGSDQTLYATARQEGCYKSVDAGQTWKKINRGLKFLDVWQNNPADPVRKQRENARSQYYNINLVISPDFKSDRTLFLAGGAELYKSMDGGESWKQMGMDMQDHLAQVLALSVSPDYKNDRTLMVSIKGGGLLKSTDGGESFTAVGHDLIENNHSIQHVAFSPLFSSDQTLLAASEEHLFQSKDGGVSWCRAERPVRYEDNTNRQAIYYHGKWEKLQHRNFSAGYAHFSKGRDSRVNFKFVGTGANIIGPLARDLGRGKVFIDGKFVSGFSQSGPVVKDTTVVYTIADLDYGPHQMRIEVAGDKEAESRGEGIAIDAFDIIGSQPDPVQSCFVDR